MLKYYLIICYRLFYPVTKQLPQNIIRCDYKYLEGLVFNNTTWECGVTIWNSKHSHTMNLLFFLSYIP